jgi:hypothetical protein
VLKGEADNLSFLACFPHICTHFPLVLRDKCPEVGVRTIRESNQRYRTCRVRSFQFNQWLIYVEPRFKRDEHKVNCLFTCKESASVSPDTHTEPHNDNWWFVWFSASLTREGAFSLVSASTYTTEYQREVLIMSYLHFRGVGLGRHYKTVGVKITVQITVVRKFYGWIQKSQ